MEDSARADLRQNLQQSGEGRAIERRRYANQVPRGEDDLEPVVCRVSYHSPRSRTNNQLLKSGTLGSYPFSVPRARKVGQSLGAGAAQAG